MQSPDVRMVTEAAQAVKINAATAPLKAVDVAHDQRLDDLEVLGGLNPGNVNDATTASLIRNQESDTHNELSAAIAAPIPTGGALEAAQPVRTITTFQAGHGWTVSGASSSDLNSAAGPAYGTQFLRVTTNPTGGAIADSGVVPVVDTRGRAFRVTFRVPHYLDLLNLFLYVGDDTMANAFEFRYSNGESDPGFQYTRGGEWATITLNWGDLSTTIGAPDKSKITRFRLSSVANNTNLVIDFNELSIIPEQNAFPKGVITFCFDDQHESVLTQAAPTLSKHQIPATIFAIKDLVGTAGFMNVAQLKDVERRLGWEVAAHAYSESVHGPGYTGVSGEVALADMRAIRDWLTSNGFKGRDHLAYPHGYYDADVMGIAKQVFTTARGTVRRTMHETLPPGDPYRVRCLEVFNTDTPAYVKTQIDKATANKSWLILLFHILSSPASALTSWTPADFSDVAAYAASSGAALRTYGEAVRQGVIRAPKAAPAPVVTAACSARYTAPDSTIQATVPGMSVTFQSNGPSDVHQIAVSLDIKADGGAATLVGVLRLDGAANAVGNLAFQSDTTLRTGASKTWIVSGLQAGSHTAAFQVALAATPTSGFTIYEASSTITAVSPV